MTVYDLIRQYADKTEEEQRQVCIHGMYDLEDVNYHLDAMGYDAHSLDDDKKMECLEDAVTYGESDEQVGSLLDDNLQAALDEAGVMPMMESDDDDDDGDETWDGDVDADDGDEGENGIEDGDEGIDNY